jgi:uncharacterized RDD family membrane protein YckC
VTLTAGILLGYVFIPALTLALAYFPIVTYLSRGLVSPYAKADVRKRFFAALLDGSLVTTTVVAYQISGSLWFLAFAGIYAVLRDSIGGQSVGKLLCGLTVISLETGRPVTAIGSVRRNLLFLLPGANVVAVFLEARTILRDPQGQRLGDRLALTQVVDGFAAREFASALIDWLQRLLPEFMRGLRPRRRPAGGFQPRGSAP